MTCWTTMDPLTELLVRLLHWEPFWSRSGSESSVLWLSSELESWAAMLSVVLLLRELLVGVPGHKGGGSAALFNGATLIVSVTSVEAVETEMAVDCETVVQGSAAGVSVMFVSRMAVAHAEVSLGPGGTGAFLFLCWVSDPI